MKYKKYSQDELLNASKYFQEVDFDGTEFSTESVHEVFNYCQNIFEEFPYKEKKNKSVEEILEYGEFAFLSVLESFPEPTKEEVAQMTEFLTSTNTEDLPLPTEEEFQMVLFSLKNVTNELTRNHDSEKWMNVTFYMLESLMLFTYIPSAIMSGMDQEYFQMAGNIIGASAFTINLYEACKVLPKNPTAQTSYEIATSADWLVLAQFLRGIHWEDKSISFITWLLMALFFGQACFYRSNARKLEEKEKTLTR
ncbi:MAG: hypothetical protein KH135_01125 [Firmicutes bacterium]|nr:hypothetical protein [Bacillota bacterium]